MKRYWGRQLAWQPVAPQGLQWWRPWRTGQAAAASTFRPHPRPRAAGEASAKVMVMVCPQGATEAPQPEEWILEKLPGLYGCQEEGIPELEMDVNELLGVESDETQPPGSRSCWLIVTSPLRPLSLACWKRSGACRSTPGKKTAPAPQSYSNSSTAGLGL